jgi:hypothetical protein
MSDLWYVDGDTFPRYRCPGCGYTTMGAESFNVVFNVESQHDGMYCLKCLVGLVAQHIPRMERVDD